VLKTPIILLFHPKNSTIWLKKSLRVLLEFFELSGSKFTSHTAGGSTDVPYESLAYFEPFENQLNTKKTMNNGDKYL
jgi:hypothetical protein